MTGGGGIMCVSHILPMSLCSLSLSNFLVIMLLQLHRYEEEEWGTCGHMNGVIRVNEGGHWQPMTRCEAR